MKYLLVFFIALFNWIQVSGQGSDCNEAEEIGVGTYSAVGEESIGIFFNDDLGEMTLVGDAFASAIQFDLFPGESYYLVENSRWSDEGFEWSFEFDEVASCPTLLSPTNNANAVPVNPANNFAVDFDWINEGLNILFNNIWFGTDPNDLTNLGAVGGEDASITLQNLDYGTTYYWSIIPEDEVGVSEDCSIFSFTTLEENPTDSDGDGVPDIVDCAPMDMAIYQGAPCDDGNAETFIDIIAENCICSGSEPQSGQFCESALAVGEGSFSNAGINNVGGFNEACFQGATGAIWYAYTASADGVVNINSDGQLTDTRLSVYGNCDATDCLVINDDISFPNNPASQVYLQVISGNTYYLQWDNFWSNQAFSFEITLDPSLSDQDNDGILDGIDNCQEISNSDQLDLDEDGLGDSCDDDIDGDFVLNEEDCEPLNAAIFPGNICDDGNAITFNDEIQSDCTCQGFPAGSNVNCGSAISIEIGEHSSVGPVTGNGASNVCFSGGENAIWYQYSATSTGTLIISSADDTIDTRLSVYDACPATNCLGSNDDVDFPLIPGSEVAIPVVQGQTYWIEWDDPWSDNSFSFTLSYMEIDTDADGILDSVDNCLFTANADQEDLDEDGIGDVCDFDIDGDDVNNSNDCEPLEAAVFPSAPCDDGNVVTLNDQIQNDCSCQGTPAPSNQTCATAIDVSEGSFVAPGPFIGNGAVNQCETGATHANWYRYSPSESGFSLVYSCIDIRDTRVSVYTGDCGELTCVGGSDDDCGFINNYASVASFTVEAGETYLIEWDDRWDEQGFNFIIINNSDTNDTDGDGLVDQEDNCFEIPNSDQLDLDLDFIGDACDDDLDGDLVPNDEDCDPLNGNLFNGASCNDGNVNTTLDMIQADCTCEGLAPDDDADQDGIFDVLDNCINESNPLQEDMDGDGVGDLCDMDIDGDFILNTVDCDPLDEALNEVLGSTCDDGVDETINDIVLENCLCQGVVPGINQDCNSAIEIGVGTFFEPGPIQGSGASNLCGSNANDASWYQFTATETGTISISSSNVLGINTNLSVYSGCDGICLGSNNNISETDLGSNVLVEVQVGDVILIEWDDLWSGDGFAFTLDFVVGIASLESIYDQDILVYPNPTEDILNVRLEVKKSSVQSFQIYDASGRIVSTSKRSLPLGTNVVSLSTRELEGGLYFLVVPLEQGMVTRRFSILN